MIPIPFLLAILGASFGYGLGKRIENNSPDTKKPLTTGTENEISKDDTNLEPEPEKVSEPVEPETEPFEKEIEP